MTTLHFDSLKVSACYINCEITQCVWGFCICWLHCSCCCFFCSYEPTIWTQTSQRHTQVCIQTLHDHKQTAVPRTWVLFDWNTTSLPNTMTQQPLWNESIKKAVTGKTNCVYRVSPENKNSNYWTCQSRSLFDSNGQYMLLWCHRKHRFEQ